MADHISASRTDEGGNERVGLFGVDESTLDTALYDTQRIADIPGSWWQRYPAAEAFPEPTLEQSIVYTLMYPQGGTRAGVTGYRVYWTRT